MVTDEQIGQRVREIREQQRAPQQSIAITMRVAKGHPIWRQTTVSKVESGERPLGLAEAVGLAEVLGVSLADLTGEKHSHAEKGVAILELLELADQIEQRIEKLRS